MLDKRTTGVLLAAVFLAAQIVAVMHSVGYAEPHHHNHSHVASQCGGDAEGENNASDCSICDYASLWLVGTELFPDTIFDLKLISSTDVSGTDSYFVQLLCRANVPRAPPALYSA